MPEGASKVIRTLHLKFTLPGADPAQLSAMMKSAKPFWEFFGTMRMRLLQNVDDPGRSHGVSSGSRSVRCGPAL